MAYNARMVFLETSAFSRQIRELLPDEDYRLLQLALLRRPDLGDVIPGAGGIRKARWSASGRGKRGGSRIIYYWHVGGGRFYMLLAYAKSERDDLTAGQIKVLRRLVEEEFG